jgi:tetratricopeptide (TPR) repeat protein
MYAKNFPLPRGEQIVKKLQLQFIPANCNFVSSPKSNGETKPVTLAKPSLRFEIEAWPKTLRSLLAFIVAISLLFLKPAIAQENGANSNANAIGGTHSIFQLGVGARAIGLGSAVVAMPSDASTVYWNPGGLDFLERRSVMLFYSSLIADTRYHFIGVSYPMLDIGTIGMGWLHYDTGDITTRDFDGLATGVKTAGEDLFLISYAKQLPFALSVGGSFKFQRQQIVGFNATGFGGDLGLLYRPELGEGLLQNLAFGLTIQNLVSPRLKLRQFSESVPQIIRGGAAKSLQMGSRPDAINLFFGFEKRAGLAVLPQFGSEYVYQNRAMLRFGYNGEQMSFGGGVLYQMFQFDYAFGKFAEDAAGDVASQHRVSISVHFGKTKTELYEVARARELQRIEAETRKKEILNRQNDYEDKMTTGKTYFQQGDYFQALIRFSAAQELAAGSFDVFSEAEMEDARIWVDKTNQKISEEERLRQEKIKQEEVARVQSQQVLDCVETQMQKGLKYVQANKYRDAIVEWQRGLECDPENQQLKSLIQKAEQEMRNRKNELLRLAQAHESQRRIGDAIRVYNQLLSQNATTAEEQKAIEDKVTRLQKQLTVEESFQQAYSEYLNKNYCAAKGLFAQALQIDPNNAKLQQYVEESDVRCNARLKDFDNDNIRQRFLEASGMIQKGNYEAALRLLEQIQREDRYNKRILDAIDLARDRMKKGQ